MEQKQISVEKPSSAPVVKITVSKDDATERVDHYLAAQIAKLNIENTQIPSSSSGIQKMIQDGFIEVFLRLFSLLG